MTASLPGDGTLRIGQVSLPAGRRVRHWAGSGGPVAWVTDGPVGDPGLVWRELSRETAGSGLVPFVAAMLAEEGTREQEAESFALLDGADSGRDRAAWDWDDEDEGYDDGDLDDEDEDDRYSRASGRPWDSGELGEPEDIAALAGIDTASFQAALWEERMPSEEELADTAWAEEWLQMIAPFSARFPGLAPAGHPALPAGETDRALRLIRPARIGLAAADRPADLVPSIGWQGGNWHHGALALAAVLRSWEDRFGARLLRIGYAQISLLATRPPRDLHAARILAAEQWAFCDECGGLGLHDVAAITKFLMASPVWTFWWD